MTTFVGLVVGTGGLVVDVELVVELDDPGFPNVEVVVATLDPGAVPSVVVESPTATVVSPPWTSPVVVVSPSLEPHAVRSTSATTRALAVRCIEEAYRLHGVGPRHWPL